jgi:hypothetical protein
MNVTPQESGTGNIIMKIEGAGNGVLRLVGNRGFARLTIDGRVRALPADGNIVLELGERWKAVPLEVDLGERPED